MKYFVDVRYCINANNENEFNKVLKEMNIIDNEYYSYHEVNSMEPKYNVGDKIVYLDIFKEYKTGVIKEIDLSKDKRNLYLIYNYPYLRYEEEILGLHKDLKDLL